MNFLFNRDRPSINRNTVFRITQEGTARLQESFDGSYEGRILMAMETTSGMMNMDDIARAARLSVGQLERTLPKMVRKGYLASSGRGELAE